MDFGVLGFEGIGSGFLKQGRSGSEDDEWRALKMAKTQHFSAPKTMPLSLHQSSEAPQRCSAQPQEQMLSFSSLKSEATQNGAFPYYQHASSACTRNAESGSLVSSSMHGYFAGTGGPFTPSQWSELQHQALIYKYITTNVPVPPNLLIPFKRSFYGLSYPSSSFGWGSLHLGFSGSTDPEPGRCRRTDGKKWRCSRDAVADQKYCDRHINRGRHRSRKPVEGQTGHAASLIPDSKAAPPMTPSLSTSVMPGGCVASSLVIQKLQFKNVQHRSAATISPPEAFVNRMQPTRGLSMNLKSREFQEPSELEFGLVSSDSLLNPLQISPFIDFSNGETQSTPSWNEELKPDWTQLSMSLPMALSDFSSSSASPTELETGLELNSDLNVIWMPSSWKNSTGGPLGEVLRNSGTSCCKNSSEVDLWSEGRDSSPELRCSPTGVLFGSLSNSSSGSSPRSDTKSFYDGIPLL